MERLEQQIAAAEAELRRATVAAEAGVEVTRLAREALSAAEIEAGETAAVLEAARLSTVRAGEDVAGVGRAAFMGSGVLGDAQLLLEAGDPDELVQRASTLELLGEDRAARLAAAELALTEQQAADRAARDAVTARTAAFDAAAQAESDSVQQLAAAQEAYDAAAAQQQQLQERLRAARITVATEQGVVDPAGDVDRQQEVESARATAGAASLVTGRVTSCYGSRGGGDHNGIDIAAPIGTPIYAPDSGVVLDAGPANGFGLAVYIQHDDGTISLYGHIDQFFVRAGQVVQAGQLIAEVGNRGQSTGPHLHVETHTGGLYANRIDPAPWLAARGVSLGCG